MHQTPDGANDVNATHEKPLKARKSGLVRTRYNYRAGEVTLAQVDIVRSQLRFVIIDVFNCDVDFHKRLQTYKNTAGRR